MSKKVGVVLLIFLGALCSSQAASLRSNPNFQMQKKEITFTTAKVNEMTDNLEADKVSISKFLAKFQEAERNKDGGIQKLDVSTSPAIASLQKLINDVVPAVQVFSAEEANCPVTTAKKLDSGFAAIKSSLKLDQISKDFADARTPRICSPSQRSCTGSSTCPLRMER